MSDFAAPWTVTRQAPLSMGFPRQEYWMGCHFLLQGVFPNPGIEPMSPALAGGFFTTELPGKPFMLLTRNIKFVPSLFSTLLHRRSIRTMAGGGVIWKNLPHGCPVTLP